MSKPTVRTTTGAVVTLTVQISNVGSWGPDCTTDQVYRQAVESAIGRIRNAFTRDMKVVGTPVVQAITTDMERRP